jgi:DNA-binding NarL/FixJ family response regulator
MALSCLIVDDNPSFLEASRAILEGQEMTVVGVAATAAQGLERADELEPDVILVDVDLGEDSGFELSRALAAGPGAHSKVILISTHAEDDLADLIEESPAIGFVSKSNLSTSAVKELLRRHSDGGRPQR